MKSRNYSTITLAVLCGVVTCFTAFGADRPRDPGVHDRQRAQQNRVQQGARSGEWTAGETKSLKQEERAYQSDGKLAGAERKDLHQDANQVSRDLSRQKHDPHSKPTAAPRPPPLPPRRRDPLMNARQGAQQARLKHGVPLGELTRPETAQLRQKEKAIRTEERAYKADGKLTPVERKDLHQDLNGASKEIHQQKHDAQSRPNRLTPSPKK